MWIPAALYGAGRPALGRAERWSRRCLREASWPPAEPGSDPADPRNPGTDLQRSAADLRNPAADPGPILLAPPSPGLAAAPAFQVHVPPAVVWSELVERGLPAPAADTAFHAWLARPWGLLGLLAPANVAWLGDPGRYRPLLAAVIAAWPELTAVGARYSVGSVEPAELWSVPSNLTYVLANMGLSPAELAAPLPPGGLAELAGRTAGWDGRPAVDRWD